jgi:para-nitrobenzyl esterase
LSSAEAVGTAFAVAAGCGSGTGPTVAACLRALPAATIESLSGNGITASCCPQTGDTGLSAYVGGEVGDGQILPTVAITAFENGNFNHVPIIIGDVENEGEGEGGVFTTEYYESPRVPYTEAQEEAYVSGYYSGNSGPAGSGPPYPAGTVAAVMAHYPLSAYPSPQLQWGAVITDGAQLGASTAKSRHIDQILANQVPIYAYEFRDQTAPFYFPPMPGFVSLAYHTGDIQYYWPLYHGGPQGITHPLNILQELLSDELVAAWTNFAYTGNPNGAGNRPWPRYTSTNGPFFAENLLPAGLSTETDAFFSAEHQCAFWDSLIVYAPAP